jgi:DNA-binding SARP family transcriptional activator
MFDICVFGTTVVRGPDRVLGIDDLPDGRSRQLLEILALERGAMVTEAVLVAQLWAGRPPPHAVAALAVHAAVLRRALQPGVTCRDSIVRTTAGGYRLDGAGVRLDLDGFDAAVAAAERATPTDALLPWQHAADLSERRVLEHEPDVEWAHATREGYLRRGADAAARGAQVALAMGRHEDAIRLAHRAVTRDPLTEHGWQVLVDAYGRAGRQVDAARTASDCLEALARHRGVYPSPRTSCLLGIALDGAPTAVPRHLAVAVRR